MNNENTFIKCAATVLTLIAICIAASSIALSVSNYYITIEAMKNGYVQESHSNKTIWVKENEKEN